MKSRSVRGLVVHQDARYARNRELRIEVNYSCNKNRSVQLVARNRECPKGLNNVPCVVWSCIKMHATYEIVNARKGEITFYAWLVAHQDARYVRNRECPKG